MKIKQTFMLLTTFVVLLLISCKKSDNSGFDKKLKYLTKATSVQDGNTVTNSYTYDDKKRLISSTTTASTGTSTTTYAYNGKDLFEIESINTAQGYRQVTEFTYAIDGAVSTARVRTYRNNALSTDITYRYYLTAGRVTAVKHDIYTDTYTYDNRGNITKVDFDEFHFANDYTYDNNPGIYTNGFPKYVITSNVLFASPNNQTSRPGVTTTYIYDAEGYPTAATAGTTKITYIYTEM